MKKIIFFLFIALTATNLFSQCPTVTVNPTSQNMTCPASTPVTFTATPSYTTNVTSRWIGNNNITLASTISNGKSIFEAGAPGTYTVEFTDNSSMCVVTQTVYVTSLAGFPYYTFVAPSLNLLCTNSSLIFSVNNVNTAPTPGGPVSFAYGSFTTTPVFTSAFNYTVNSCGNYYVKVKDNTNACETSYSFAVSCGTLSPSPIIISGTNSVCIGSSTTFSASGVNTYTWSTASTTPSINVTPTTTTNYSVSGTNAGGCVTNSIVTLTVNPLCAQVWPGDANSDGIVDNSDVFELGLWNLNTGMPRAIMGNVYTAHYADNWTGNVSTGKNRNHADCNGDGIINSSDTLAIFNNFLQTHAFKTSNTFVTNADITIVPTQTLVGANALSSADIYLGDVTNQMNNIYGVAFDVQFDSALVQNNSVYISDNNSFLNAGNTNIHFKKTIFANEKLYTTSVRTNGNNVSGNGKIATLYFKTKANYPLNSVLNLSIINPKKIDNNGTTGTLTAGTSSLQLANDVGINEALTIVNFVSIFPNPAKDVLYINNNLKENISVKLMDVLGKSVLRTSVLHSEKIDLKGFTSGVYFVKVRSASQSFEKKIIIE